MGTDAENNLYATDFGENDNVQKLDNNRNFLMAFGSPGTGNGQFNTPFEPAVDSGYNVYVVDNDNNRVQVFDNSGKYVTQFGNAAAGHVRLEDPIGIALNSLGDVYVADGGILTYMYLLQLDSYTVTLKYNFRNHLFFVCSIEVIVWLTGPTFEIFLVYLDL
ncbi:MAG: hypothetical protein M3M88_07220 [Thermoproteota archaeon]|nr:hypothetical protein [Thermoproteota archaeon]